jgi:hypothetical protein
VLKRSNLSTLAVVALAALLGYAAASANLKFNAPAIASPSHGPTSANEAKPADSQAVPATSKDLRLMHSRWGAKAERPYLLCLVEFCDDRCAL